jgi:hypothetical protein
MKKIEMIGKTYGMLKVLNEHSKNKNGHIKYTCLCECGVEKNVFGTHLRGGKIVSCGCKNRVKGVSGGQWYSIIKGSLKTRQKRSNLEVDITKEYINNLFKEQCGKCALSGLDITLPERWKDRSYTASLDRIDSSIGYVKDNIQWVHKKINIMKNMFPQGMFIFLCNKVSENNVVDEFDVKSIDTLKWGLNEKYRNKDE